MVVGLVVVLVIIFVAAVFIAFIPPMRGAPAGMATRTPIEMLPAPSVLGQTWEQSAVTNDSRNASASYRSSADGSSQVIDLNITVFSTISEAQETYEYP